MLIIIFIFSIVLIIFRSNIVRILLGWDGLGITSFLLVIYYGRRISLNAGYITAFTNRLGDIGIIFIIYFIIEKRGWNWVIYNNREINYRNFLKIIVFFTRITKRAQIPFRSWLPAAIAAPTPVSSLVHSSTLVTAGVYILVRFREIFKGKICIIIFLISSLTSLMARIMAFIEKDIKKVIALSTLSHLGVIISIIRIGYKNLSFVHLLFHAYFKALLFIRIGLIIHLRVDYQDSRIISSLYYCRGINACLIVVSLIRLCGIPFIRGFFSKDFFLEIRYLGEYSIFIKFYLIFYCLLSFLYSIRLIVKILLTQEIRNLLKWYSWKLDAYYKRIVILYILSIRGGKIISLIIFENGNFLFLEIRIKVIIIIIIIMIAYIRVKLLKYKIFVKKNFLYYLFKIIFIEDLSRWWLVKNLKNFSKYYVIIDKTYTRIYSRGYINSNNRLIHMNFVKEKLIKIIFLSILLIILLVILSM